MASDQAVGQSEEFRLLEAYCSKRSQQRSDWSGHGPVFAQGWAPVREGVSSGVWHEGGFRSSNFGMRSDDSVRQTHVRIGETIQIFVPKTPSSADRLLRIADSAPIPRPDLDEDSVPDEDDIVQKLVEIIRTSGDKIDEQLKQNNALVRQLQTAFNYAVFERLTTCLQSQVSQGRVSQGQVSQGRVSQGRTSRAAAPEDSIEREKIAWAFEVTSRLSAMDLVPRRRVLSFGERYLQQHHSAWVKERGGWEEAFDGDVD